MTGDWCGVVIGFEIDAIASIEQVCQFSGRIMSCFVVQLQVIKGRSERGGFSLPASQRDV